MAVLRNQITCFRQADGEYLFEAWERYKDMMRLCLHHALEKWLIIHAFYNGLLYNMRMTVDVVTRWALMDKPFSEAYKLIENMAQNHYQWGCKHTLVEKSQTKDGIYKVEGLNHVNAKVYAITQKIENRTITPKTTVAAVTPLYEIYGV